MQAALETLSTRRNGGRTVAVLGDMAELGPETRTWHTRIGAHAADLGIDLLVAVGPLARGYLEGAVGRIACSWFPDRETAGKTLPDLLQGTDVVLLKGSRCAELERLAGPILG
jgi:UDP-N-acetylmuramoyl-tripeptide--D-alanyl-D-alanine ligase